MNKKINLIVAEDHKLYRETIVNFLKGVEGFNVTSVTNGLELLKSLNRETHDLVLLDLEMPIMDGSTAFTKIKALYPKLKIIVFSQYDTKVLQENFKTRGADGYISKNFFQNLETIVSEIKRVASEISSNQWCVSVKDIRFTPRELEIIPLLCEGKTTAEIARLLNISDKTVGKHKNNLYKKTGTDSFAQLMKFFCKRGLDFLK